MQLPQITDTAARFLLDAADYRDLGVELKTLDDKAIARELVAEGFGSITAECVEHGQADCPGDWRGCQAGLVQVFQINDDGQSWLVDRGMIAP